MKEVRKCRLCQKCFVAKRSDSVYCSPGCRKEGTRLYDKERKAEERARNKEIQKAENKPKKKSLSIAEIDAMARAEGLSYGKYVAKMGLK